MAEYIERAAAIARIKEYAADVYEVDLDSTEQFSEDVFADNFCNGLWSAIELIDDIPADDVAPVVHCRHCRSYNKPRLGWCSVHLDCEGPDDFCGYGVRMDGEAE